MHLKNIKTSTALHCFAWQNISTQHYVMIFNYIFHLQTITQLPCLYNSKCFWKFWWQILCLSKTTFWHSRFSTFTFKKLKWKLSLLSDSLQFLSQNSAVEVFRSIGEFTSPSIDMNISSEKSLTESSKMQLELTQKTKSEE